MLKSRNPIRQQFVTGATCFFQFVTGSLAPITASRFAMRSVTSSCTVNNTLNFGSQKVRAANVNQAPTLQVQCTGTAPYNTEPDSGTAPGTTATGRQMTSGANSANYSFYSDRAYSAVRGLAVGTNTVAGTGKGATQTYGRVLAQTASVNGDDNDTVTVTVAC